MLKRKPDRLPTIIFAGAMSLNFGGVLNWSFYSVQNPGPLGIQLTETENGFIKPRYYDEEVFGHLNHHLRI